MCTSVPQIDAMSTRIRTSDGVGSGIGTLRTSVLPGADLSFTAAFIVDVMTRILRPRACAWACGISTHATPDNALIQKRVGDGRFSLRADGGDPARRSRDVKIPQTFTLPQ